MGQYENARADYLRAADKYVKDRDWSSAAYCYKQLVELAPTDRENWNKVAILLITINNAAEYQAQCQAMLQRLHSTTTDPQEANMAAWICALAPAELAGTEGPARLNVALTLANFAVGKATTPQARANYLNTRGAVHYRRGDWQLAINDFTESIKQWPDNPANVDNWVFLAMAHARNAYLNRAARSGVGLFSIGAITRTRRSG